MGSGASSYAWRRDAGGTNSAGRIARTASSTRSSRMPCAMRLRTRSSLVVTNPLYRAPDGARIVSGLRDLIATYIELRREQSDRVKIRPHPYEFPMCFDG